MSGTDISDDLGLALCGETSLANVDILAPFRLDGRRAVVTGASSGIGKRIARVLHAAGAQVAVGARRGERLDELCQELGDRSVAIACDIRRPEEASALIEGAVKEFGGLEILVNNAGALDVAASEEEDLELFRDAVTTNLVGLFHLTQLAARAMLAGGGGSIINIGSILGLVAGTPFTCAGYCASKGGVVNLTRELGVQWAPRGVRVNTIAPGYFHTEMTTASFHTEGPMSYINSNTPMGRPGDEHELDGAVLFLAGDASTYVTGATIPVDGGWTAR